VIAERDGSVPLAPLWERNLGAVRLAALGVVCWPKWYQMVGRRGVAVRSEHEALEGEVFLEELEATRREVLGGRPFRERRRGQTKEQIAESKRRKHAGGDGNHRFEGERYLNCEDKQIRRMQLRKLVDEGGQDSVGGPMPSHPVLDKWHSLEFGLTEDEIRQIELQDASPETLILQGWWYWVQRSSPWQIALGSALIGEGEKRLPEIAERYVRDLEETRDEYLELGVDVDRAMALMREHAPIGVDAEHAELSANMVRDLVDTPELQDEMRKIFVLGLQGRGTRATF
jgi:pyrroloquinoline quinone (PQQ) biosynthesis protein C